MGVTPFPLGSRVRVTSAGPLRGRRGTVCRVHTIAADLDELFCFYFVALDGAQLKQPIWFACDEVELWAVPLVAVQTSPYL